MKPSKINRAALGVAVGVVILAGSLNVVKRQVEPFELVTKVLDGDTFVISNKQTIRLYSVDAPELGNCFGEEAKEALTAKILNRKVLLKKPRTEAYKRVQAYVYLNGEFVNEYLALNGYVDDQTHGESEDEIIKESANFAKQNKIGIYGEICSPSKPSKVGCNIKANINHKTRIKTYRLPGCRDYEQTVIERFRGEDFYCTEKEAHDAGFSKASTCT